MNQVAELTELNKATLYLYFANKDDLIDAIVYEGLLILDKEFQQADQHSVSGLKKVINLIKITFEFYKKYPIYFYTMNHQERRKLSERTRTPYSIKGDEIASRIFRKSEGGLRQGIEEGSIRKDIDIHRVLILFYAQTYGIMHTIYSKEDVYKDVLNMDPDAIEKSALEFMEYYLK
jgi:AcrR family transcriptional regulator